MAEKTAEKLFEKTRDALRRRLDSAQYISGITSNIFTSQRNAWLTYIFSRLIINAMSIETLIQSAVSAPVGAQALDHFSIASIGRTSIESALMALYISEPSLSDDEWNLRKSVIDLHDATNRYRMFKPMKGVAVSSNHQILLSTISDYKQVSSELKDKIRLNPAFARFEGEKRDKALNGGAVFVDGQREVVRESGWDISEHEHVQSYLSAFVHSHPVSFHRADRHEIDFKTISEPQYALCSAVLIWVEDALEKVQLRVELVFKDEIRERRFPRFF